MSGKGNNKRKSDADANNEVVSKKNKLESMISFKEAERVITNWTFKARVTNKSDVKNYSNGNLFSFDLVDSSGKIRCIVYHPWVEIFFEKIVVNKVYLLSNVLLKVCNKNFNHFDNLFELNLYEKSSIVECSDSENEIPKHHYNFKNLMNVSECKRNVNEIIDVIGVITNIGSVEEVSNNKGVKFIKRDVELSDEFDNKLTLVFWKSAAVDFCRQINTVLLVKGGKVNDFNNSIKLSIINTTLLRDDVSDIAEGKRLLDYIKEK